jgi:hypothetical protein
MDPSELPQSGREMGGTWSGGEYTLDPVRPPADAPIRGFPSLTGWTPGGQTSGAEWLKLVASGNAGGLEEMSDEKIAKIRQQAKEKFGKAAGGGNFSAAEVSGLGEAQTPEGSERIFGDIERFNDAALGREAQWHLTDQAGDPNKGIAMLQSLIEKQQAQNIANRQMLQSAYWMGGREQITDEDQYDTLGQNIRSFMGVLDKDLDRETLSYLAEAANLHAAGNVEAARELYNKAISLYRKGAGAPTLPTDQADVNPATRAGAQNPSFNPQSLGPGVVGVDFGR